MDFYQPRSVEEAAALLADRHCLLMAGGTDIYPAHLSRPVTVPVLDITRIQDLRGISPTAGGLRIGAATTWREVIDAPLPAAFDGLKQAAREVGSWQIQNRATIAGNLCNASPAADGVPPLLALNADVELQSVRGVRRLPLEDFILANRKTARAIDEIMTAIVIPDSALAGQSAFRKLGARRYLVISIVMVAVRLVCDDTARISSCAIAVGSCSPVARRMRRLEQALIGQHPESLDVRPELLDGLSPIDDVRAPAKYRLHAARELIIRTVRDAAS